MKTIKGFVLGTDGELQPVQVSRPTGGGLAILAGLLGCEDWEIACIQLTGWVHLWHSENQTSEPNQAAARITDQMGTSQQVRGKCLLVGTKPQKWEMTSLTPEQAATITAVLDS